MFKIFGILLSLLFLPLYGDIIDKEGKGYLEIVDGQKVLHLEGSPYEIGYQHGRMLKEQIQHNISAFIDAKRPESSDRTKAFLSQFPLMMKHVSPSLQEEMLGVAEGSGVPLSKIVSLNLFPEMFHCSGITVGGEAAKKGALYHVRVLDYAVGKHLQESAVLMVVKPEGKIPFLNVAYAGFIGSITGMNGEKISMGEIGGQGYGHWDGIPMAFLIREVLENAKTLEDAKQILSSSARTCEYYYVISDGKTNESTGVYATASQIHFIEPGSNYTLLAPHELPSNYGVNGLNDKFFLGDCQTVSTPYQTVLYHEDKTLASLFHKQPKDTIVLTGFENPDRYPVIVQRIMENYGRIDHLTLQEIIKQPVARPSNLHNAIFLPSELKVWISHAGPNDEPACDQPYHHYSLTK